MKVQIKQLVGRDWQNVPIKDFAGKSMCDYLLEHRGRCVVAVYQKREDKEPAVFFVNKTKDLETYEKRGKKVFHAQDVVDFLGSPVDAHATLAAEVMNGGEFLEIGKVEEERPLF